MASSLKPITFYGEKGPNPVKVIIVAKELGVPYEVHQVDFADVKKPEYLAVNPNGRLPAMHDPNAGLTLWESGAIVEYLVENYDKAHKFSYPPGTNEHYLTKQWVYFQASGQGPYYGQAVWFHKYHQETLPSARERYLNEINRVTAVVEGHLAKQKATAGADGPWLVGDKPTFADLSWYTWQWTVTLALGDEIIDYTKYPNVKAWLDKMASRPSVKFATSS
ncbi:glutathione S-transferase [Xylaria intraflava]|nr:glutathione S-transferase [Xylaria intraflava]